MPKIDIDGISFAFVDAGAGPPVVLVHGSGSSRAVWRSLSEQLVRRHRVIVPDLCGHGLTELPPNRPALPGDDDMALIAGLAGYIGAPFHLVGHSYGAAISLKAALDRRLDLLSLTLVEPTIFEPLRRHGDPRAWREISDLAHDHMAAAARGDFRACADLFMGYWIGTPAWQSMPLDRRDAIVRTMPAIAAAWPAMLRRPDDLDLYPAFQVPTLLIRAGGTTYPMHCVADLLQATLPNLVVLNVPGAGHMVPLSHPQPVNAAIEAHLVRHDRPTSHDIKETRHDSATTA